MTTLIAEDSASKMGRVYHIDVLAVLFGIGTWVCVNGLWVELPLLVQPLPEGWNLPSYMSIVTQLANIGPLSYTILHSLYPSTITEKGTIYLTMTIGCISTILLAFFWDETTYLFGSMRSTALLSLVFCLALVDCSSRVLFLPFMARFQEIYLTSFFIGEGLSGLVPSLFALIQGVGGNPECITVNVTNEDTGEVSLEIQSYTPPPVFSIEVFFVILFVIMLTSAIAYHLLTYERITKNALAKNSGQGQSPTDVLIDPEHAPVVKFYQSTSPSNSMERINKAPDEETSFAEVHNRKKVSIVSKANGQNGTRDASNVIEKTTNSPAKPKIFATNGEKEALFTYVQKSVFVSLLITQAIVCAMANGMFPSIQSYSCLPYGNVAYHWAVTLSTMANPAVCFLLFILPAPTLMSIYSTCVAAFGVACYCLATAVMSPTPPLVGEWSGEALLVFSWILQVALFTYIKVSIATVLRAEGKRGLFWCGAVTQAGSAVGAIATFFVVNNTTIFQSYYACQGNSETVTTTPADMTVA